jgi:hypothetical protein
MTQYLIYHFRWQISGIVMFVPMWLLRDVLGIDSLSVGIVAAQFIGACFFWFVDKWIFRSKWAQAIWSVKQSVHCVDCGKEGRGYRLVESGKYNRSSAVAEYRCESCSIRKAEELKGMGVEV